MKTNWHRELALDYYSSEDLAEISEAIENEINNRKNKAKEESVSCLKSAINAFLTDYKVSGSIVVWSDALYDCVKVKIEEVLEGLCRENNWDN